jgi:hypothetical protein
MNKNENKLKVCIEVDPSLMNDCVYFFLQVKGVDFSLGELGAARGTIDRFGAGRGFVARLEAIVAEDVATVRAHQALVVHF